MNTRRLALFLSVAILIHAVAAGEARCPGNVETIRYHPVGGSQIAVSVVINRTGPYEFLVDTGSELTLIEPSLAAELELRSDGEVDVDAIGSHSKAALATPDLIEVGPVAVSRPLVVVAPLHWIQAVDPKVRGLLGGNFLGQFDLLIDYAHKLVCFDEAKHLLHNVQGEHVPLIENSDPQQGLPGAHRLVIPAHIGGEGSRDVLLMLDSASNAPLLYTTTHMETPAWLLRNHAELGNVVGRGSQLILTILPSEDVRIGSRVLADVAFAVQLNAGRSAITRGDDGLIPTALFRRVFISYAGHFVIFDPR